MTFLWPWLSSPDGECLSVVAFIPLPSERVFDVGVQALQVALAVILE